MQAMQETWVWYLGQEDSLEKEMATHSSIVAWKIPWTEEPGWLQSMRSQSVRNDWACTLWPTSYRLEIPVNPSSGSTDLLQWLIELSEMFYLLDHQFIRKSYNSGTARWKRCIGSGMGEAHGTSALIFQCAQNQKLSEHSLVGFLWRLLCMGLIE